LKIEEILHLIKEENPSYAQEKREEEVLLPFISQIPEGIEEIPLLDEPR